MRSSIENKKSTGARVRARKSYRALPYASHSKAQVWAWSRSLAAERWQSLKKSWETWWR